MTQKEIDKKLTFGGRYLLDILNQLESDSSVLVLNNLSKKQLNFLEKECGVSIKKTSNNALLSLSKRKNVKEIDLEKYLES